MKERRFERVYTEGTLTSIEIWVDTQTGVNYLVCGPNGITVLVDENGKPIVTPELKKNN